MREISLGEVTQQRLGLSDDTQISTRNMKLGISNPIEWRRAAMKKVLLIFLCLFVFLSGCSADRTATEPAPAEDAAELQTEPEPVELTLGGLRLEGSSLERIVKEFNEAQTEVHISLRDYGEGISDMTQAITAMNTALLAGDSPDLISFDVQIGYTFSPLPYIAKGLLLDLDPYFAASDGLTEEILIWDALHQYGGVYLVSPLFSVETVYCTQETYDAHRDWTLAEYQEIEAGLSEDQNMIYYMTPENFVTRFGSRYLREALDFETASCQFDTPEFREILNGATKAGVATGMEGDGKNVPERLVEGQLMACYTCLDAASVVAFDRWRGGETLAYIGWPTPEGGNGSDITLELPLGVSAQTAEPDACWTFLEYCLTHPIMRMLNDGLPAYRPALPDHLRMVKSFAQPYETTQEDLDQAVALAETCQTMSFYDENALAIILEEADLMFQGQATLDETVAAIQKRVSLYMAEQYG